MFGQYPHQVAHVMCLKLMSTKGEPGEKEAEVYRLLSVSLEHLSITLVNFLLNTLLSWMLGSIPAFLSLVCIK